jgi:hypothetical protein
VKTSRETPAGEPVISLSGNDGGQDLMRPPTAWN